MSEISECWRCGTKEAADDIVMCPTCHRGVCRHCSVKISGRGFCSQSCADYFFHGDDDDAG